MPDAGPYRVVVRTDEYGRTHFVEGMGLMVVCSTAVSAEIWRKNLNTAHRAATEKAAKVVEAARKALPNLCDGGPGCCDSSRAHDELAQALADYDRSANV